jgi:bifunctional non-homologous end joining protein LigD
VDGEIVALDPEGRPSFQALQHRSSTAGYQVVFYAFDLLHLNGRNLRGKPLVERRAKLPDVVGDSGLRISEDWSGDPRPLIEAARNLRLEGVVAKRKDSIYEPGERSSAWQKIKLELQQELVVGGYRPAFNAIDALLVGYYKDRQLPTPARSRPASLRTSGATCSRS